ncbi:MAG: hypothetical protein O3B73_03650 [bacterium]|nr:hypothetical protein [bacterium]
MPPKSLSDLSPNARNLTIASLNWSEQYWNEEGALLALGSSAQTAHLSVRNSIWFALGLFLRNEKGDISRANRIIHAVIDNQFDEPGTLFHGTYYRYVGEPHPPKNPTTWKDFDPNWRQFIGTVLAVIREEYTDWLTGDLTKRIDRSIQLAIEGEPVDRCPPSYTNIALMKAVLMTWAGHRYHRADWMQKGEAFALAVHGLFTAHGTFDEYNSPTYYGVNFYALALWRLYAHSDKLAQWGSDMEAGLWRDVAQSYHADLQNMCGPFTRSYGMDMPHYGALLGMSIWLGIGRDQAPFPNEPGHFDHCHDFVYGPCFGLAETRIPEDVRHHFTAFSGEHQIEKRISQVPDRVVTAYLGKNIMIGAEATPLDGDPKNTFYKLTDQFHPATVHWKMPGGKTAWMRLRHIGAIQAHASQGHLDVAGKIEPELLEKYGDTHQTFSYQFYIPAEVSAKSFGQDTWLLPGLTMTVKTELPDPDISVDGHLITVCYHTPLGVLRPHFAFEIV